jgi:ABC-type spermidine/putrescine transport system permease subunit I
MVATTAADIVRTADGIPLKEKLRQVELSRKLRAFGLVLPLFLFVFVSFGFPIADMLWKAIDDPEYIGGTLAQTMDALRSWDGEGVPDEPVFAALAADLKAAQKSKTSALIGKRLNYVISGIRSKIIASARKIEKVEAGPFKDALIGIDPVWGEPATWQAVQQAGHRFTNLYLMTVLDRTWPFATNGVGVEDDALKVNSWLLAIFALLAAALIASRTSREWSRAGPYLFAGALSVFFLMAIQQSDMLARYGVAGTGIVAALGAIVVRAHPVWRRISMYLLCGAILCLTWFVVLSTTVSVDPDQSVYVAIIVRTFGISILVTLVTLILGFPVAYLLASLPNKTSNLLMILVLLPFWTSLLVRTTAWFVLLQDNGVINDTVQFLQLADHPLKLIFSRFGTVVAMTHIQLPFTLLPIYSVMKTIPPSHVRAARSLGAGPFLAFWKVYFPQTVPGIAAGCLLTFILCLGYYITPALVGGPTDQMVSGFIALAINQENNWGKASALGTILLAATMVLYFVYNRLIGIDKMKFG